MCKDHRLSPPVIPLVECPVLDICVFVKLASRRIVLEPIPAVFFEPTVLHFQITLGLVITVFLESVFHFCFAVSSHAEVIGTVELEIVPRVVLTQVCSSVVGARLVVLLLQAEFRELSHCAVRANKHEGFFIFGHIDIRASIFVCSHVSQGDHGNVVGDLHALCA